jgi:hypothetical protein
LGRGALGISRRQTASKIALPNHQTPSYTPDGTHRREMTLLLHLSTPLSPTPWPLNGNPIPNSGRRPRPSPSSDLERSPAS